ncbi:MAG: ABC transporter ATP-binding protein [Lachnospiraceae bacterium]|nr:ABC transporter ATP-binding protein [Lachnospiraceae bacterium]
MIEVKDLVKKYGDHIAVDHLSFTVEKGQILGFLGPNGAGKSTTMNMLTGYISSTEGSIVINGHDIYEEPEETKKSIGYLPEQPPVYPDMTVQEYLRFVMNIKKVPKNRRAAMLADIMERTGITEVSGRLIKHLSKGYRQRVGLAQAVVGYPEVIILDEPTVGLDPMQIIEIRELMKSLAKRHTVIISSHILSEISAVCDTVMIINKGKMVITDKVENLPKHLKGASRLELEVKGGMQAVRAALCGLPESADVRYRKGEKNGFVHVSLDAEEEGELQEKIFYALAEAKCPIYMMNTEKLSLEDIFLEMTRQADAGGTDMLPEKNAPERDMLPGEDNPEPDSPADGDKTEKGGEE